MDRAIPCWEEAWGCSLAWPWSHHTMEECGHPPPSLQIAHLLTFWVRYAKLKPRVWDKTSLWNARGRHVSLLGEMLSQVGGGASRERWKRDIRCTFSAPVTPVPDALVTGQSAAFSWWDWAAREKLLGAWGCQHCREGAGDEEYYGLERPVSPPSKSVWCLPLPSPASWVSSYWRLGYSAIITASWASRIHVHYPQRSYYNGT